MPIAMYILADRSANSNDWKAGDIVGVFPDDWVFGSGETPYESPFGFVQISIPGNMTIDDLKLVLMDLHLEDVVIDPGDPDQTPRKQSIGRRFRGFSYSDIPPQFIEDSKAYDTRPSGNWNTIKNYIRNKLGVKDL